MKRSLVLEIMHIPEDGLISTAAKKVFDEESLGVGDPVLLLPTVMMNLMNYGRL